MSEMFELMHQIADLGGPVILILIGASIYVLAVALYKALQFRVAGLGHHRTLHKAVEAWDAGDRGAASKNLSRSKSYLVPVIEMAFRATREDNDRLVTEAERRFAKPSAGSGRLRMWPSRLRSSVYLERCLV